MTMMISSRLIVEALSAFWSQMHSPEFHEYVEAVYHKRAVSIPIFSSLFIGETEGGDLNRGPTAGLLKSWWAVDNEGVREISYPKIICETTSDFFHTPIILFYQEGEGIAIFERLGQGMACWKSGGLKYVEGRVEIHNLKQLEGI